MHNRTKGQAPLVVKSPFTKALDNLDNWWYLSDPTFPLSALQFLLLCFKFTYKEWTQETLDIASLTPVKAEPKLALLLSPQSCYVALGCVCVIHRDLWVTNLAFPSSLVVVAEVCLAIISRTTSLGPATPLQDWLQSVECLLRLPQVVRAQGISS